jgi:hypothetical protein
MTELQELADAIDNLCAENLILKNLLRIRMHGWKEHFQKDVEYLKAHPLPHQRKMLDTVAPADICNASTIHTMTESLEQILRVNDSLLENWQEDRA